MIIGIFFPNLKIIVKIKPKITDKNIISNKKKMLTSFHDANYLTSAPKN